MVIPCNAPKFNPDEIVVARTEMQSGDESVLSIQIKGDDAHRLWVESVRSGDGSFLIRLALRTGGTR